MASNRLAGDLDFHVRVKGAEFEELTVDLSRGELLFVREAHFDPVRFAGRTLRSAAGIVGGAAGQTLPGVKRSQFHFFANSHQYQGNDMSPSRSAAQIVIPVLLWLADHVIHPLIGQLAHFFKGDRFSETAEPDGVSLIIDVKFLRVPRNMRIREKAQRHFEYGKAVPVEREAHLRAHPYVIERAVCLHFFVRKGMVRRHRVLFSPGQACFLPGGRADGKQFC